MKWAGGKTQLLPALEKVLPSDFRNYHEPFAGSAALFFYLHRTHRLSGRRSYLYDLNQDLILAFRMVQTSCPSLLPHLQDLESHHHALDSSYFYARRDEYNDGPSDPVRRAALFIYLNRTCFNGLYRVNRRGKFNAPIGTYTTPTVCDSKNLHAAASALTGAELLAGSFAQVLQHARSEDLVYFDPPYDPVSETANFTSYTKDRFDFSMQRELSDVFRQLALRGCYLVLSNAYTQRIETLYTSLKTESALSALDLRQVPAARAINSDASRRGSISEYLVVFSP